MISKFEDRFKCLGAIKHPLALMVVLGLGIRMVLMPILTFNGDVQYWLNTEILLDGGFGLYGVDGYYYTPIWGYVIAFMDGFGQVLGITDYATYVPALLPFTDADYKVSATVVSPAFACLMKIPLVVVDLVVGLLLYRFVKRITDDEVKSLAAFGLWFFSALVIAESSIHAMFDNISVMFLLLAVMFAYDRKYYLAGASFGLAVLTKFFPIFMLFFLIAYVIKKEGIGMTGAKAFLKFIIGAVVAFFVIELPAILDGQFWSSLFFLTSRIGISNMPNVNPVWIFLGMCFVVAGFVAIEHLFKRRHGELMFQHFVNIDPLIREHMVRKTLVIIAIMLSLGLLAYSIFSVGGNSFSELFTSLGMKAVMFVSVYSVLLEIYISYRLLFMVDHDDGKMLTYLMLSSVLIFLWPPAPQYVIVIVPFLVLYTVIVDSRFFKPYMFFTLGMFVYEIVLGNITCLFSISVYSGIIGMDLLIPVTEFITSDIGGIPVIGFFMGVFGLLAYLSMLYVPYFWYKHSRGDVL